MRRFLSIAGGVAGGVGLLVVSMVQVASPQLAIAADRGADSRAEAERRRQESEAAREVEAMRRTALARAISERDYSAARDLARSQAEFDRIDHALRRDAADEQARQDRELRLEREKESAARSRAQRRP